MTDKPTSAPAARDGAEHPELEDLLDAKKASSKKKSAPTKQGAKVSTSTRDRDVAAVDSMGPSRPAVSADIAEVLPVELRDLRAWMVWRLEVVNGVQVKVPYYVTGGKRHGKNGSAADRGRLSIFEAALKRLRQGSFDGLALAMLPNHQIVVADLDRKPGKGTLPDAEWDAICSSSATYWEWSPGGGRHAFFNGNLPANKMQNPAVGIDLFFGVGFLTVTGHRGEGAPSAIADLDAGMRARLLQHVGRPEVVAEPTLQLRHASQPDDVEWADTPNIETARSALNALDPNLGRADWVRFGQALKLAYKEAGFALWHEWSARANPDMYAGARECRRQWDSFGRNEGSGIDLVRVPTILEAARKAGWSEQPEPTDDDDLASFKLPELPDVALYGVLRGIVSAATANSEATRPGVAAAALVYFAARFGAALGIDVGDEKRTLALYILLVGPTGRGRKGTSAQFVAQLFAEVDKLLAWGWGEQMLAPRYPSVPSPQVETGVSSGEGLIRLVRDEGVAVDRGREHYLPGVADKRLLLDLSEFSVVFSKASQEGSILSTVIRNAFDGRDLGNPTNSNPLKATGAHICIFGHITMAEFQRRTVGDKRSTETSNGMLNRFCTLYSVRDKLVASPKPVPDAVRHALAAEIANNVHALFGTKYADHTSRRVVVLPLTDAALALWEGEYPKISSAEYANEKVVGSMLSRRELLTRVLAALLAAMNGESVVGVEALRSALAWGEYMAETNTRVFTTWAERKQQAQLQGWVARLRQRLADRGGSMTKREIRQSFGNTKFDANAQDAAIRAMLEASPPQLKVEGNSLRLL